MKPRLIRLCISFIIADVILVGASNAAGRFDPEDAVGIWLFDEGKGKSVKDFTGHDNDGEIMNGAKWINGKFGMALSFDGSNQHVEINNPVNLPEMNHSISVWVNPGKPQKQYANIVGNHVAPFTGYVIQQNADNLNSFYSSFGGGGAWSGANTAVTQLKEGTWQHLVTVREKDTMTHYLNGKKSAFKDKINSNAITDSALNLLIGEWVGGGVGSRPFNGMIDELVIINRAMTLDEIDALFGGVEKAFVVSGKDKIAATWGDLKNR